MSIAFFNQFGNWNVEAEIWCEGVLFDYKVVVTRLVFDSVMKNNLQQHDSDYLEIYNMYISRLWLWIYSWILITI